MADVDNLESLSDIQLVALAQNGQRDAFGLLVKRHHQWVIGLCASILGNQSEGEDAAQEVFLKAYRSLDLFRGEAAFSTWVYRIAYFQSLDALRSRKRRATESLNHLLEEKGDALQHLIKDPATNRLNPEDKDLIQRLLNSLLPEHKNVLILREMFGFTYEEISQITGGSLDSVKGRLKRARKELHEIGRHFLNSIDVI